MTDTISFIAEVPRSPPPAHTYPMSYTTRLLRLKLPPREKQALWEATGAAEDLHTAARNWVHATNFFEAHTTYKRMHKLMENIIVATKTKKVIPNGNNRPDWQGFLERPLTDPELDAVDGWKPKPLELWELVHVALADAYDISLSFNHNTGEATATLKDQKHSRASAGYALSARDGTGVDALKALLYKHFTVLEGKWDGLLGVPKPKRRG